MTGMLRVLALGLLLLPGTALALRHPQAETLEQLWGHL